MAATTTQRISDDTLVLNVHGGFRFTVKEERDESAAPITGFYLMGDGTYPTLYAATVAAVQLVEEGDPSALHETMNCGPACQMCVGEAAMERQAELAAERYYEGGWDVTGAYSSELVAR